MFQIWSKICHFTAPLTGFLLSRRLPTNCPLKGTPLWAVHHLTPGCRLLGLRTQLPAKTPTRSSLRSPGFGAGSAGRKVLAADQNVRDACTSVRFCYYG